MESFDKNRGGATRFVPFVRPGWFRDRFGSLDGRGVRIALIDSGWDRSIDWIESIEPGVSFVGGGPPTGDDHDTNGHGTECAWLVASVAPAARITPVRIFADRVSAAVTTLLDAFAWAVEQRFDIVSLSLGTGEESALPHLYEICERAQAANVLVVASMDPAGGHRFPAGFDNTLSVQSGTFTGPFELVYLPDQLTECFIGRAEVDVMTLGGGGARRRGSSYATPQATGLLALLRQASPGRTLADVRRILAEIALPAASHAETIRFLSRLPRNADTAHE